MLTNNWKNLAVAVMSGMYQATNNTITPAISRPMINTDGSSYTIGTSAYIIERGEHASKPLSLGKITMGAASRKASTEVTGVIFGDGTTPPSVDDYWLSGTAITTIATTASGSVTLNGDGTITKTAIHTISNTSTTDDVTISEVGYVDYIAYLTNYNGPNSYFLLDRTLLEEPVTIPPGGVGQVTYNVTFDIGIYEA